MNPTNSLTVGPMSASAIEAKAGSIIRITDIAGGQPGDLVAFNLHDLSEHLSQARTRVENKSCRITAGHTLWSNAQPPRVMFTVLRDTAGNHDLLYTACCRYALEKRFGVSRDGCHENLVRSLEPWGVTDHTLPDGLNLFFNVDVAPDGSLALGKHSSAPGTFIELRAEIDCLISVVACSVPRKDAPNTPFKLEVFS